MWVRGVRNVKVGDRVLPPLSSFTWRGANGHFRRMDSSLCLRMRTRGNWRCWLSIPRPPALLLSEYVDLKTWRVGLCRNAANSGVGRWVIAFAKSRGLKTVNIVRRPELVPEA